MGKRKNFTERVRAPKRRRKQANITWSKKLHRRTNNRHIVEAKQMGQP